MILAQGSNGLLDGLVSYWNLNGNSNDSVGDNNGVDTSVSYVNGKIGKSGSFNGSTSVIYDVGMLSSFSFIQNTGIFTINFWIRTTNFTNEQGLILNEGNTVKGFYIEKYHAQVVFYLSNGSQMTAQNIQNNFFIDTNWHLLTLVGDGVGATFYKDGSQFGSRFNYINSFSVGDSTNKLKIGSFQIGASLTGEMDEVGIWNRALSQTEILQLYNNGNGISFPFIDKLTVSSEKLSGLISYYKLDGNSVDSVQNTLKNGIISYWKLDGDSTDFFGAHNGTDSGGVTYSVGKIGQCAGFNGGRISVGQPLLESAGSISFWMKPINSVGLQRPFCENMGYLFFQSNHSGVGTLDFAIYNNAFFVVSTTWDVSIWSHIVGTWDSSIMKLYKNGILVGSLPCPQIELVINGSSIGNNSSQDRPFYGSVDEVSVWNRPLTQDEITKLYNQTSLDNFIDSVGGNDGIDTNISYTSNGKIGKSAYFNGSNSQINTYGDFSLLKNVSQFSVSMWINPANNDDLKFFINKWNYLSQGTFGISTHSIGGSYYGIYFFVCPIIGDTGANCTYTIPTLLLPNEWHHIACVFDGYQSTDITRAKIYVDGILSTNGFLGTIPTKTTSGNAQIQMGQLGNADWYTGLLDEVSIWNKALTQVEVLELFTYAIPGQPYGAMKKGININTVSKNTPISDSLVLHLDGSIRNNSYPGYGATWSDISGQNNDSTLVNGPTFDPENEGSILFDGINDYVNVPTPTSVSNLFSNSGNKHHISFWVKAPTLSPGTYTILFNVFTTGYGGGGSFAFWNDGGMKIFTNRFVSPSDYSSNSVWFNNSNKISNICFQWDGTGYNIYIDGVFTPNLPGETRLTGGPYALNSSPVRIAGDYTLSNPCFSGNIYEVKAYSRELTPQEILENYKSSRYINNASTGVMRYNNRVLKNNSIVKNGLQLYLDGGKHYSYPGSGTTWYDLSGNGYNGILYNSNTSPFSGIYNGPTFDSTNGGSIYFDGLNDFCEISGSLVLYSESFTVNVMVKFSTYSGFYVLAKAYGGDYGTYWFEEGRFGIGTTTTYYYTSGGTPTLDTWYYYTGVYHNNTMKFYINGVLVDTNTTTGSIRGNNGNNIFLGKYGSVYSGPCSSSIGNFTYYDRDLSPAEILQNYNAIRTRFSINKTNKNTGLISYWKFDNDLYDATQIPIKHGLVSYWKLDGNSIDYISGNNGTDTAISYTTGKINYGAQFNGSTSKIQITSGVDIPTGNENRTYVMWVNPSDYNGIFLQTGEASLGGLQDFIFMNYYEPIGGDYYIFTDGYNASNNLIVSVSSIAPLSTWTHLSFTLNGQDWKYYKNGILEASGTFPITINTYSTKVVIGKREDYYAPITCMNGLIDEVGIWNRTLSQTEILQLYNNGDGYQSFADVPGNNGSGYNLPTTYSSGIIGQGLSTDAVSNKYVKVKASENLIISNIYKSTFSISLWVKSNNTGQVIKYFISKLDIIGDNVFSIIYGYGGSYIDFYCAYMIGANPGYPGTGSRIVIPDTNWHHIVYTYNGTTWCGYKDGVQIFSTTISFLLNTYGSGDLYFNTYDGTITQNPDAHLDEVGFWNRGLTQDEVLEIYNGGLGRSYPF